MTRVLLIDNYDSFTHNLYQALAALGAEVQVVRNDAVDVPGILASGATHLVLSPGPGRPEGAGVTLEAVKACAGRLLILGVCLGHQAVAMAFGGRLAKAATLVHGKTSRISHDGRGVFAGMPDPFTAARYHSLAVEGLPECLEASARTEDGTLMGLRHRTLPVEGVQFHPESFMTPEGSRILANFLAMKG